MTEILTSNTNIHDDNDNYKNNFDLCDHHHHKDNGND